MNRETQSLVMLLLGGVILRISLTDTYLRYVKQGLQPYLIASGAVLVLVGLLTLWRELASRRPGRHARQDEHAHGHGDGHGDGHGHGGGHGTRSAWLLVLPVLAVLLIAPPSLGSYAANRSGTATSIAKEKKRISHYAPLPPGNPVQLPVLDYAARAVFDDGVSLDDRQVKLVGFISPRAKGGNYLTRMIMFCCSADSRPIKVALSGKIRTLKADQWVEVIGSYDPKIEKDPANNEEIPYLHVQSLRLIKAPTNPYDS